MAQNLHIGGKVLPTVHVAPIRRALESFCVAPAEAQCGDPVGVEISIVYDRDGNIHVAQATDYIARYETGYRTRKWRALCHDDPLYMRMGIALMEIGTEVSRKSGGPRFTDALDTMSIQPEENEHFTLGLVPGGAWMVREPVEKTIEDQTWVTSEPTQDFLDTLVTLLWPGATSAHARLAQSAGMKTAQDVLQGRYAFAWNDIDPIPFVCPTAPAPD